MKYLGIDFGSKKIGLALSDESGKIAFPYSIIKNTKTASVEIQTIVQKEKIKAIVVGFSLDQTGAENKITNLSQAFSEGLKHSLGLPLYFEKEFFTSTFARQNQRGKQQNTARQTKKAILGNIDAQAAALILQRFLDRKK